MQLVKKATLLLLLGYSLIKLMVVVVVCMLINRAELDHFSVLSIIIKVLSKPTTNLMFIDSIISNLSCSSLKQRL